MLWRILRQLRSNDWKTRKEAVDKLGQSKDPRAVKPLLLAALKDENKDVRHAAADVLANQLDERGIEVLVVTLKDKNKDIRQAAHYALRRACDARSVQLLVAELKDEDSFVRYAVADVLGEIGDSRSLQALVAALEDEHSFVRLKAANALAKMADERGVKALVVLLQDKDPDMRATAAIALGEIGDKPAVEPLIAALKDEAEDVRSSAAIALGEISDVRAVEALVAALKDKHWLVRDLAAKALVKINPNWAKSEAAKQAIPNSAAAVAMGPTAAPEGADPSQRPGSEAIKGGVTTSRFWRCPHCGTILQKPSHDWMNQVSQAGAHISGTATCPKCLGTSSQADVYRGNFDVPEEQITCSNCGTNFRGPWELFSGKPCPVCGNTFNK
jgi:HEAT repeat protein